jgi:DNA-directed RNA polymerase specialized sigma24 family protein
MVMDISTLLRHRNRQSFDWLYDQYAGSLLSVIRKMVNEKAEAEKLLLETFVAVWNSLEEFEGDDDRIFIWMLHIARAKVAEYENRGWNEDHVAITNNNKVWTPSLQKRTKESGTLISGEKQAK